jgi:REP element-mobilizing transposase RayT
MMAGEPIPAGYRALRRGRVSIPGQIYCLTTATAGRRPIFADFWTARIVVNAMRDLHRDGDVMSLAFVVMPDHVHWLVECGSVPLANVMKMMKCRSARRARRGTGAAIWQPGFHDHAARREESVVALARYIIMNPVRAGLVTRVGDYPLWDCAWL